MGKKRGAKKFPNSEPGSHTPISLREEATGKIQTKPASNIKSILRIEHLKKLAVWATNDAPIPSLGAFYGQHLATLAEAAGVPPDPSLITCQRCETVLHPGFNSTVRIEKNKSKVRNRHKKSEKGIGSKDEANEIDVFASRVVAKDVALIDGLATPSSASTTTLLEGKKRSRNSSTSKKATETASMSARVEVAKGQTTASKRRRKSWTSLKEIAHSNEHEKSRVANLTIPFFL
ncbi:RNAse P, Rpr2/Rpp21 subunit [Sesbania bispinosa]|nr:RNAse P, Rpr2/Rpp21 subunit [Sesbania bispinosa]